jgi:hypothetical protein
MKHIHEQ